MPKRRKAVDTTPDAAIGGLAGWIGGKRTLAPAIVAEMGTHRAFYDVCCGSAAVLFAKKPAASETINDLHRDLINLAIVVQQEPAAIQLQEMLDRTLVCDEILQMSAGIIGGRKMELPTAVSYVDSSKAAALGFPYYEINRYHIERAYHYLICCWMGRGGEAGGESDRAGLPVRWTSGGGAPAKRFRSAADSLPFWNSRLHNVLILCRDMFEVLASIADEAGTVIYIDPPYFATNAAGQKLRSVRYRHEFDAADHLRLGDAVSRFRHARVILSYYFDPMIFDLFPGFRVRDVSRAKNLSAATSRDSNKAIGAECLLLNGNSFAHDAKMITRESIDGGQMSILS